MYEEVIEKLRNEGILFSKGLDENEIKKVENLYNIRFPRDLAAFYKKILPISNGFYNWRDFSQENTEKIKKKFLKPQQGIMANIEEMSWVAEWGVLPSSNMEKYEIIKSKLKVANLLIPIFGHRYMASQYTEGNPVFSIHGADVICYGGNLTQYFMIEFKYEKHSEINYQHLKKVDFWSDLL